MVSIKDDNNVVELKEKLDELLIEYMSQLDLYQSNQVELSKELKIVSLLSFSLPCLH